MLRVRIAILMILVGLLMVAAPAVQIATRP
ncbi:MAG: hypothetical protein QOJ52_642 [Acidimicrobiaceae bacterium]|jgi:hypothetical protein|nr:hypothetical protein [Acidimicrobiaceae bacterium]MDQ1365362.1 hypothetical protein [Acidimicrobiaceae bacterium]MDQ1378925.1 hypothetical protein [Acidimicrobiaceae bacterium]MDQ1399063.1 hypothetical protein [Acidimicrobiaceae bacterium]MDQ1417993.1 hypothetical protein [Acidimicrobiaceae bacterium]